MARENGRECSKSNQRDGFVFSLEIIRVSFAAVFATFASNDWISPDNWRMDG
jgi:hypothetical protein